MMPILRRHAEASPHPPRLCRFCIPALFFLLLAASSDALGQYRFDNWNTGSGLPHNNVVAIQQTRDGYLWLATKDGLVRYDGVRFTVFNKSNTPGISSNRLTVLFIDRHGDLLVGTEDGGLIQYQGGVFTSYSPPDRLPVEDIVAIQEDAQGTLWLISHGGIIQWQAGQVISFTPAANFSLPAYHWHTNLRLKGGGIWYADPTGLHRFKQGHWVTTTRQDGLASLNIQAIYEDHGGALWLATADNRIQRLKEGHVTVYPMNGALPVTDALVACEDRKGNLWMGSANDVIDTPARGKGNILFQLRNGQLRAYPIGFAAGLIEDIYQDREETIWVATRNSGLYRIREQVITTYTVDQGLVANNVYPICEGRDGAVWIGAWGGGLSRWKDDAFINYPGKDGDDPAAKKFSTLPTALYTARDGRLWLASYKGIHIFENEQFHFFEGGLLRPGEVASVIIQDRAGAIWLGTQMGLIRQQPGGALYYTTRDGLAGDDVKVIIESRDGALWIGTYGGLTRYVDGRFTSYTEKDGLASNRVRALYEDADGVLWVGTYDGGLSRFKDGRFTTFTPKEGLYDHGAFVILEDAHDNLWMSSNRGIYRVSRQELNEFAAGQRASVASVSYDRGDGLRNIECNGGRWPAGIKTRDGRLWFATQEGVAVVDPEAIPRNVQPPPVMIEQCVLDRALIAFHPAVRINPGQQNLEIQYAGLSFIKPEQMRFKYRLEGLDADWIDAGARRVAYYPYLPPGHYVFRVIAANSDGVWNLEGAAITITVVPPFYRAGWFIALVMVTLAGVVFAVYERRIARFRKARAAQEKFSSQLIASQEDERKRIAAELHDGLGQSLLIIKNRAMLGLKKADDQIATNKQLGEIEATVSQAIEEVRTIAHNLRPYQLDRLGLTKAIEAIVAKAASVQSVNIIADIDDVDGVFSPESEINLYRIVQEGVNNIIKHSQATRALVAVKRTGQLVEVTIRDDGKGFDPEANGSNQPRRGFGLTGIKARARIIGGACAIRSAPGNGTEISVNMSVAHGREEAGDGQPGKR